MNLPLSISLACLAVFAGSLLWAAVTDARTFKILHKTLAVAVAAWIPFAFTALEPMQAVWSVALAAGVLVAGYVAFATLGIGAGDAKLLTVVALWAGLPHLWPALVFTAVSGGALAIAFAINHTIQKSRGKASGPVHKVNLPYGVAISCGGIAVVFLHLAPLVNRLTVQGV